MSRRNDLELSQNPESAPVYVPLEVVGSIQEKGFPGKAVGVKLPKVAAPEVKSVPFPVARHRSKSPLQAPVAKVVIQQAAPRFDRDSIDLENRATMLSMSAAEMQEVHSELTDRIRPEILEMLRKRGADKEKKVRDPREPAFSEISQDVLPAARAAAETASLQGPGEVVAPTHDAKAAGVANAGKFAGQGDDGSRGAESHAWTQRVEAVRFLSFYLDGRVLTVEGQNPSDPDTVRDLKGTAQKVAERDLLRSEGDPAAFGYSLLEAVSLVRSTVPGQRTVALRLISSVLNRAVAGLQEDSDLVDKEGPDPVDWQAIWAYALGPEPELALTLRLALDDTHTTVVAACVKALQALLSSQANETLFSLHESVWPGERPLYTAPVFRRQTKKDEGLIAGGRWKYNVKPDEMTVATSSQAKLEEGKETIGDDVDMANRDVAAGLIKMGILPRIRFILEVEKNVAAEEPLIDVVISIARHSPGAAEAVMKCPRLMDTIIQQFLASDENLAIGIRPAHTKAIQLLKVLSQATRSNCVRFAEFGALQVAQSELFQQAFLLPSRTRVGQEYLRGLCPTLVEALRLWRVCISYGIGISLFSDFYPALCFWLAPFSEEEYNSKGSAEAFCLTQESFNLLEKIARTLPLMHPDGGPEAGDENSIFTNWTWAVAVPLVNTALDWLSPDRIAGLVSRFKNEHGGGGGGVEDSLSETIIKDSKRNLLGALSSVLHFLATVCARILPLKETAGSGNACAPWLPTFVPQLGLSIVNGNLLAFVDGDSSEQRFENGETLTAFLCSLRLGHDYETSLIATSCLHGIVRLVTMVDHLLNQAKLDTSMPELDAVSQSRAHCILTHGLAASSEQDFRQLLVAFGDEVILNQNFLFSCEAHGHGGPAPGVGLGWGSQGGGIWSKRFLSAKISAILALDLLQAMPAKGINTLRTQHLTIQGPTVSSDYVDSDFKRVHGDAVLWRLQVGLGIAAVVGPGEGDVLKKVLTTVFFDGACLTVMLENVLLTLELYDKLKHLQPGERESKQVDFDVISKLLFQHYSATWLSQKQRSRSLAHVSSRKNGVVTKLPRIDEDSNRTRDEVVTQLGREWAGQRLPLPAHWFLSSLTVKVEQARQRENSESAPSVEVDFAARSDGDAHQLQETVKAGLFFLLALESMADREGSRVPVRNIGLERKIHALSTVFVSGGDIFFQDHVRDYIGALQEIYGLQLDGSSLLHEVQRSSQGEQATDLKLPTLSNQQYLNFDPIDSGYSQFVIGLAENFSAESYGDIIFARQVAFHLRRDVPDSYRLDIWQILAEAKVLHLLPPISLCCGQQAAYLYPLEVNAKILDAYMSAWTAGSLDKAATLGSMSFLLALHQVALFIFGDERQTSEDLLVRKRAARSLLSSAANKPKQQSMLQQLIYYKAPNMLDRWLFLATAVDGDKVSMAALQKVKEQAGLIT